MEQNYLKSIKFKEIHHRVKPDRILSTEHLNKIKFQYFQLKITFLNTH